MSLVTNLQNFATAVATDSKLLNTLINGNFASNSALTTAAKSNLVQAINEINAAIAALPSSSSVTTQINAAIAAVVGLAPENLNTLKELADANSDLITALANRVRVDAVQSFSSPQQDQACQNMGAVRTTSLGDTSVDLVSIYTTGRA